FPVEALGVGTEGGPAQEGAEPWGPVLQSLVVEYALGPALHQAHVTDPKDLALLRKALRAIDHDSQASAPSGPTLLGRQPVLLLDFGPDRDQVWQIAGRNQIHHPDFGRWILAPDFFLALEAWIRDREEAPVALGVENPFPADRLARMAQFQGLRDRSWLSGHFEGPSGVLEAQGAELLQPLFATFQPLYVPSNRIAGPSWGYRMDVQAWIGPESKLELLDAEQAPVRPLHAVLLRHETLGLVWVPDTFREAWLDLYEPPCPLSEQTPGVWKDWVTAAPTLLAELAQPDRGPIYLRTSEAHATDAPLSQRIVPIASSTLSPAWRQLWTAARIRVEEPPFEPTCETWRSQRELHPELLWRGHDGVWHRLVANGDGSTWLVPGVLVQLPGDPWPELERLAE
ncbi:MAG TPA: hypothetical protein P5218_11350, partial [Planctomycetota bacterium]|nr:hypothetical protein [Planctomycetota bacterium]